ncbi:PPK2 family polyphosphate:nucleotide phosphotransferase [Bradyrhizobium sp. LM3.4]
MSKKPSKSLAQELDRYITPFRYDGSGKFHLKDHKTDAKGDLDKEKAQELLDANKKRLIAFQEKLYAQDRWSVLIVFQAMDAGGKDSAIKAIFEGINPQGCEVSAFKAPSSKELDHDFLWRHVIALPERGHIGIFNRSHYEECLVTRVHPEILAKEKLPQKIVTKNIWKERFEDISAFERYLSRNGTVVLKFFLNLSKDEQRERFLDRLRGSVQAVEVLHGRHQGTCAVAALPGGLSGHRAPHGNAACAVVCRAGRSQMVRPRRDRVGHRRSARKARFALSARRQGVAGGIRRGAQRAGERGQGKQGASEVTVDWREARPLVVTDKKRENNPMHSSRG